jgi:DNA-binding NtrC family response regulator
MKQSILVVDDSKIDRQKLIKCLSNDFKMHSASDGFEALKKVRDLDIEIILSDMQMPGMDGIELLEKVREHNKDIIVIVVTGFSTIESAVTAMRKGAYDYLTKPIDVNKLEVTIKNAIENKELRSENIMLKKKIRENFDPANLIGYSPKMQDILEVIERVSFTKATALILGESGTGKELVANVLHYNSDVADGPFVKVNCSALAEGVLESELFGHEKGAFTGALYKKKGRFELANGGTLFLDEIGDLPLSIQVKLLRFLQESEFERVGGTETIRVDIRIITATNKNLSKLVKEEKFRDDLYYRLKVVTLEVPPLRERKEDIPMIAEYHLNKFAEIHNKHVKGIATDAMKILKSYHWPGNIRELMNCIESMLVMSRDDMITVDNLPPFLTMSAEEEINGTSPESLYEIEKTAILSALNKYGGDKATVAKILGIGLRTLYNKLDQYYPKKN